ncbi:hypothetical protein NMG60_11008039 [Bertholletia excelsa]
MKSLGKSLGYCAREKKPCVGWVKKYFKDCLCSLSDELSFAFGMISLVSWGVAEIPQIITNFQTKSSHGVSLLFLVTWFAGDVFNLVGCLLEPATLPTQFYTALLYTTSTVVLLLQSIYYDHLYTWWSRRIESNHWVEEQRKPMRSATARPADHRGIPVPGGATTFQTHTECYYTSARSLARKSTPPTWSYLRPARNGPPAMGLSDDSSSNEVPILSPSKPVAFRRSVGSGAIFATAAVSLPDGSMALTEVQSGLSGRRVLHQENGGHENAFGQSLGWMMAGIYMGGRIPQIWLNIKRGSVEGLNPLMFIFALVANATYVASILVRTIEWSSIKANMPWLLDAAGCVALDLFRWQIILQYIYYRYLRNRTTRAEDTYGNYMADKAPLTS